MWILEITVIGFLFGEEAIKFEGVYQYKFSTEQLCIDFKTSDNAKNAVADVEKMTRAHLNDRYADVTVKFECVADGEKI